MNNIDKSSTTNDSFELKIQVKENLDLIAGKLTVFADEYVITPPDLSLFDQLWGWLAEHPRTDYGIYNYALGIGTTALCFRWGTYLSVLMDENKPVDPRAAKETMSMISNQEMKRINIEASYNLARLLEKLHQNESETVDFILRAYDWLPMPQRKVKPNWTITRMIYAILARYKEFMNPIHKKLSQQAVQYPYRSLANTIVTLAYRNGEVENIHGARGGGAAFSMTHRRFTHQQSCKVIRETAEHLSPFMGANPAWDLISTHGPWPQYLAGLPYIPLYRWDWSLHKSSSPITLLREWCE